MIKALLIVFVIFQGISFIVIALKSASLLYGILSTVATVLEMVFLMIIINKFLNKHGEEYVSKKCLREYNKINENNKRTNIR